MGDLNASDPDGLTDGSYFSVSHNPSHGNAIIHPSDGNWTYIPQSNFFGDDNFTVTITDDLNQSIIQLINILSPHDLHYIHTSPMPEQQVAKVPLRQISTLLTLGQTWLVLSPSIQWVSKSG